MKKDEVKVICETPTPGKQPTRIAKWKYDIIAQSILEVIPEKGEGILFKNLLELVSSTIDDSAKTRIGSLSWYTTTVKLDLECKNKIFRSKGPGPQRLLKNSG